MLALFSLKELTIPKGPSTGLGLQSNECALVGDNGVPKAKKANGQELDLPPEPGQTSLRHVVPVTKAE